MPVSRVGTASRSRSTPRSPLAPISTAEQVRPAAPMSWIAMTQPFAIISRQASSKSFSANGSPTCTVGRFSSESSPNSAAGGGGVENLVGFRHAHRHGVDQNIAVVASVEADRAAHRRDPEGIAIAADASHHAGDQMAGHRMIWSPERQRVEASDRPRPHGEDIAQDAADAGSGALVR